MFIGINRIRQVVKFESVDKIKKMFFVLSRARGDKFSVRMTTSVYRAQQEFCCFCFICAAAWKGKC